MCVHGLPALYHGVTQDRPQGGLAASAGTHNDTAHPLVKRFLQLEHLTHLLAKRSNNFNNITGIYVTREIVTINMSVGGNTKKVDA